MQSEKERWRLSLVVIRCISAQEDLAAEVKDLFPQAVVKFEADENQAPGLLLRIGGAQVAWTVDAYIDGLEALIAERLSNTDLKAHSYAR